MLVLTKGCALVTVLHFPLWLLDHYLIRMASNIEGDPPEEASDTDETDESKSSHLADFLAILNELLSHTVYCFAENIDGFSLLDEYLALSVYLVEQDALRLAVLAFLGINILLVAGYNGVKRLLKDFAIPALVLKCLIVLFNNLPFMMIRIYMLWVVGGTKILDLGITNFFYFVCKEAVFLIMYFVECVVSVFEFSTRKKRKKSDELDWKGLDPRESRRKVDSWLEEDDSDENNQQQQQQPQRRTARKKSSRNLKRQKSFGKYSNNSDADNNIMDYDTHIRDHGGQEQHNSRKRRTKRHDNANSQQHDTISMEIDVYPHEQITSYDINTHVERKRRKKKNRNPPTSGNVENNRRFNDANVTEDRI